MAAPLVQVGKTAGASPGRSSQTEIRESAANEFVFGVVGHVGSGTSAVAKKLENILSGATLAGGPFDTVILKARDELRLLPVAAETRAVGIVAPRRRSRA